MFPHVANEYFSKNNTTQAGTHILCSSQNSPQKKPLAVGGNMSPQTLVSPTNNHKD